ncbi:unnamed protein product, partial [Ixodes pacificus]
RLLGIRHRHAAPARVHAAQRGVAEELEQQLLLLLLLPRVLGTGVLEAVQGGRVALEGVLELLALAEAVARLVFGGAQLRKKSTEESFIRRSLNLVKNCQSYTTRDSETWCIPHARTNHRNGSLAFTLPPLLNSLYH